MSLFGLLWNTSQQSTVYIVIFSVINGISGGIILILFPEAAINIFVEETYLLYLIILPPVSIIFIISKRFSKKKTAELVEKACETTILRIANTVRHFELPAFEKRGQADINMSIANAKTISTAAEKNIDSLQNNITLAMGWFYIFIFLSPFLGVLLLIWRLLYLTLRESFSGIAKSFADLEQTEKTRLFQTFGNHLHGFMELKFNLSKSNDLFSNHLKPLVEKIKKIRIESRFYLTEMTLIYFISIFIIIALGHFFIGDSSIIGAPVKLSIMLLYTIQNDVIILTAMPTIAEGKAALNQLNHLFPPDVLKKTTAKTNVSSDKPIDNLHSIKMENIEFAYPKKKNENSPFTIKFDSISINSGEILFVTGGNGSGKSTLMNILSGLYPPDAGSIKMDGNPVDMADYRHLFAAVLADFHLFDKIYGVDDIDPEYVDEWLVLMDLENKVNYHDGGFSALDLSTGQKKRIALVVALIEDKPIYLFDEWAADQDPHFRRYFYEYLLPWLKQKGKTIIAITHDDRYFSVADRIIKMEYGKISEHKKNAAILSKTWPDSLKDRTDKEKKENFSPHDTFPCEDRSVKKKRKKPPPKGVVNILSDILKTDGASVKKLLFQMFLSNFSMVGMMTSALSLSKTQPGESPATLYIRFIIFLFLYALTFRRVRKTFYDLVEKRIAGLRINIMEHIRKTDLETMEQVGQSKIYTALTSDTQAVSEISNIFLVCVQGALRTLMLSIYVGFICPKALLIILAGGGAGAAFYISNHLETIKLFKKIRSGENRMFDAVNHLLNGFKELRLDHKKSDDFYFGSFWRRVSRLKDLRIRSSHHYVSNHTIVYTFWNGLLLCIILGAPFLGISPDILPMLAGTLIIMPLRQFIDFYSKFHVAYLSFKRLQEFEEEISGLETEQIQPASLAEMVGYETIAYEDISYVYKNADAHSFSLGPLSARFKKGEILFITGGNGSGKSTLLKLLTGLYKGEGQTFFNGEETDIRRRREIFSIIFSNFHLFDRLYGMPEADEAKIAKLLKEFHLEKRVSYTDGQFSTLDLSTGQKKRLALLTVIMEDKPIYLFDEWAADQDPEFRKYFYMTLLPQFKKEEKTVIAVTHDDHYFHVADRVIQLDYGKLSP